MSERVTRTRRSVLSAREATRPSYVRDPTKQGGSSAAHGRAARWFLLITVVVFAPLVAGSTAAHGQPPPGLVTLGAPGLYPTYRPNIRDYVIRCNDRPVLVEVHAGDPWEASIADGPYSSGDLEESVGLTAGQAFVVAIRRVGDQAVFRYHVRCLPSDFPSYTFTRYGPVTPRFFSVDQDFAPLNERYAIVFDDHGVPVWWDHVPGRDPTVYPNGELSWFNFAAKRFEIRGLDGSLVRAINAVGPQGQSRRANPHDMRLLPDGGYLVGADVEQQHVDTSAYGGADDASVLNAELQQVGSDGRVVWDWKSQHHTSLAETGRFWRWVTNRPGEFGYDIVHWNSIEPDGSAVIASFRHLDAVYKIRQSTGSIAWKLGGTPTDKSLTVVGDSAHPTFGAQHDARLLPDGTMTVFDNRTSLADPVPRAVRFGVDQAAGTATLLESITDPAVKASYCCGSARRLENGDWLISWGQNNGVGGYTPAGDRTFFLRMTSGKQHFSYRAEPVPSTITAPDFRAGMDAMYSGR